MKTQGGKLPDDGHAEPYRYLVVVRVIVAADGLDGALRGGREIEREIKRRADVVKAQALHPEHRNDLDRALAS